MLTATLTSWGASSSHLNHTRVSLEHSPVRTTTGGSGAWKLRLRLFLLLHLNTRQVNHLTAAGLEFVLISSHQICSVSLSRSCLIVFGLFNDDWQRDGSSDWLSGRIRSYRVKRRHPESIPSFLPFCSVEHFFSIIKSLAELNFVCFLVDYDVHTAVILSAAAVVMTQLMKCYRGILICNLLTVLLRIMAEIKEQILEMIFHDIEQNN